MTSLSNVSFLLLGLPSSPVRRSTACTRASSSLTSNGLTM